METQIDGKLFKRLLNNNLFPTVIVDTFDEKLFFWSQSAIDIFGHNPKDVKDWYKLAYPDLVYRKKVIKKWKPYVAESRKTGKAVNAGEYNITCKDGSIKICELYVQFISDFLIITINEITDRKRMENKIVEQRNIAKKYLYIVNSIVLALNREGKITLLNRKGYQTLGYEEGELYGKNWFLTCLPKNNSSKIYDYFLELVDGKIKGHQNYENKILRKDGKTRIVRWFNTLVKDDNGKITGLLSAGEDITEKKKSENALRKSEERYLNLATLLPQIVFEINSKGKITFLNKFGMEKLGITPNNIEKGLHFTEVIISEENKRARKNARRVMNREIIGGIEHKLKNQDGTTFSAVIYSNPIIQENKTIGIRGIAVDISERKSMEEDIKKQHYYLKKSQELGKIGTWDFDIINDYIYWTDENYKIFGIPKGSDMNYEAFISKIHPDDIDYVNNEWEAAIEGKPYDIEHRLLIQGKVKWIREKANVIFNENGTAIRAIGFTQDITERKINEIQLEKAKEKAEKANKAKSEFLSNMSHELRNPLNPIIGFTNILYENEEKDYNKELLEMIKYAGKQLLMIINDILTLSKVESGKREIYKENINVYRYIKKNIQPYLKSAEAKNLEVYSQIDSELDKDIYMDRGILLQIIINLLSNSIKFTEKGYIEFKMMAKKMENKSVLNIVVKDTGIGIDKSKIEKIFNPFEQGEYFLTKKHGGTGLGLSIVKSLLDLVKGTIKISSRLKEGTKMNLCIPYEEKRIEIEDINANSFENFEIKPNIKVIYAEDDNANQLLVERLLSKNEIQLEKVNNGKALLEKLREKNFDLILMDIQMPKMNGYETTKIIRKNLKWNSIPIIGVSAFSYEEEINKAKKMGMNDYLSKPINKIELLEKIYKWSL